MIEGSLRKTFTSRSEGTPQRKRLQSKVWDSIRGVAAVHDQYWSCLKGFQVSISFHVSYLFSLPRILSL
ncbi:hypothetical protein OESDEN_17886 [Oesophagostomum dentatum]|uniref:Uncharacterized protein n=1 Tax=Oesophagostomum dentatum TaxID=61180 RepID=A0A0B1SGS9_OESDE|nr:hypothetical protein OESDEN_17886 [Oesophagostomum dentatum]